MTNPRRIIQCPACKASHEIELLVDERRHPGVAYVRGYAVICPYCGVEDTRPDLHDAADGYIEVADPSSA
jgi:hypothetical protein